MSAHPDPERPREEPEGPAPGDPGRVAPTERVTFERVRPLRPGDAVVRRKRPEFRGFARTGKAHLEAGLELAWVE